MSEGLKALVEIGRMQRDLGAMLADMARALSRMEDKIDAITKRLDEGAPRPPG